MRFVIQRVTRASVSVEQQTIGAIGKGFLVLIGVGQEDTREIADRLVRKMPAHFRRWGGEDQPVFVRCLRFLAAGVAVHLICRLQERQPPVFYQGRQPWSGGGAVWIHYFRLQRTFSTGRESSDRLLRRWDGNLFGKWRAIYHCAGFRRTLWIAAASCGDVGCISSRNDDFANWCVKSETSVWL